MCCASERCGGIFGALTALADGSESGTGDSGIEASPAILAGRAGNAGGVEGSDETTDTGLKMIRIYIHSEFSFERYELKQFSEFACR